MRDRKPKIYVWFLGFLVFWFPRFPDSNPANQRTNVKALVSCSAHRPLRSAVRHHSAPVPRLSNPFRGQRFGSSGGPPNFSRHTKLPFFLQKLAPEFWREERRTGILSEENRIERTTANSRASARKKDETVGADRAIPVRVPEHLACEGAAKFFAPACQVPGTCCASELGPPLALPAFVSDEDHSSDCLRKPMDKTDNPDTLKIPDPMREQIGERYEQE
jgi:hypothetical protein